MKTTHDCTVQKNLEISSGVFDMEVRCVEAAKEAKCGQFLHVQCPNGYLRRPISICDVQDDILRFIYEVKGDGLKSLSELKTGELVNILGPLGNGFAIEESENALVIGGGIGIFPLLMTAKHTVCSAILGFRSKEQAVLLEEFHSVCRETFLCTNDGSLGTKGFVTDILTDYLKQNTVSMIYACGPTPMLAAVQKIALAQDIPCQLSLEQRMACGIGACLGCAVKIRGEAGEAYKHVCKDGPVFWAKDVIFDA